MLTFPSVDVSASENMAFRLAAAAGHLHIVDMLLTLPEVNPHDSNNYALRRAAARGHFSIVDRILSLSTFDMDRAVIDEALILAAKHNHTDVVERLVRAGGSVSEENALALRLACAGGHIDVVKDLLSIGKFTMAVVYECIRKAVQNGQLAVFDMLSEAPGIDLSFNDNCLIKLAVACGHVGIARRILADPDVHPGADGTPSNTGLLLVYDGRTGNECVIRAASNGSVEMLELLLSHPLVDCTDQDHQAFVEAAGNGHVACLKTLMDRVEPITSDALWVEAALAQAARHGHVDIVQMIVDRVGDVVKQSALIAACQHNQLDAIALLSGMCATADACYSALDAAIASGNFDAAHMLLKVPGLSDYIPTALVQVGCQLRQWRDEHADCVCIGHFGWERDVPGVLHGRWHWYQGDRVVLPAELCQGGAGARGRSHLSNGGWRRVPARRRGDVRGRSAGGPGCRRRYPDQEVRWSAATFADVHHVGGVERRDVSSGSSAPGP